MRLYYNQTSTDTEPSVYTHYLYDAGGNRVKKFTRTEGGNWESITYIDGIIEYRENQDGDYQSISHVMYDSKRIATIREGDNFGDSTPAIKYNMDDHLGSSNVLVDENGTLVNFEEYYPFGETSFGAYSKKRYRFCGKEKDEESGMYYYGARYYAPWLCRFISVDPKAGKYVFQSPFAYADNNPINKMDYNGEGTEGGGGDANGASPNSSSTTSQASDNIGTPPKTIDELVTTPNKPVKPEKVHKADYKNEDGKLDKETYNKAKENYKHEMNGYKQRLADYKFLSSVKNDLINPGGNTDLLKTRDAILKAQVPITLKAGKVEIEGHAAETATTVENNKITKITITFDIKKIYESNPSDASNKFNVDRKMATYKDPNKLELGLTDNNNPALRTPTRFNIQMHEFGHVYFNLTNPYSKAESEKQAQQFEYNSY